MSSMKEKIPSLIEKLSKNNISAFYVENSAQAYEKIISIIPEGSIVGYGDSVTVRQIGLFEALEKGNYIFLNPWEKGITIEEHTKRQKQALTSDVFITGTNALTLDGKIVNIDALGNRVAGMLFGPDKVIIVVGINKIVKNLKKALERIKKKAAPLNVKRHTEFDPMPPCGLTGKCVDCSSPWRICNKTVIIERQFDNYKHKRIITVVIIGEELGL